MKIYSMTATFGKLSHETLTLNPGLNVIEAPNEWGKSTWCAFLVNMLYGIDTRARTTGSALADKERYAPWSGAPMSGRMELNWNGRDITIERASRGRLIFGDFKAYETATGIEIPELNAGNCGQMLLGVERSVFVRAGFLKLTDLPVTQDDALRRRLNNLVTTGDENGAGDRLAKQLKDLKNRCRYNRTGLLPQAESQRDQILAQLNELQTMAEQAENIRQRQAQLERNIAALENHKAALRYSDAQKDQEKVAAAAEKLSQARENLAKQLQLCQQLPPRETLQQNLRSAQSLLDQQRLLPQPPAAIQAEKPELPEIYRGMTPTEILATAREDADKLKKLEAQQKKRTPVMAVGALVTLAFAGFAVYAYLAEQMPWPVIAGAAAAIGGMALAMYNNKLSQRFQQERAALLSRHPGRTPDQWVADAEYHGKQMQQYLLTLAEIEAINARAEMARKALEDQIQDLTAGKPLQDCTAEWEQSLGELAALENAKRDVQQKETFLQELQAMVKPVEKPSAPDELTCSGSQTDAYLTDFRFELKQLQLKLGQNQGRAEALGQGAALRAQLKAVNRRIDQLEDIYAALEHAQKALTAATTELQRRFAPRISKRAQELFTKLTGGRYQRITLGEDLSLNAAAEGEDTLRPSQWRSDGTVDQLYLALRLAVAEELTPEAPLVLDDALVRFDDKRLAMALEVLQESANEKQVILFTCQSREASLS